MGIQNPSVRLHAKARLTGNSHPDRSHRTGGPQRDDTRDASTPPPGTSWPHHLVASVAGEQPRTCHIGAPPHRPAPVGEAT